LYLKINFQQLQQDNPEICGEKKCLRERRRGGNNCKTSEKNPCGIMSLGWKGMVSEYSK
jgi:hypothetical protein